MKKIAFFDLNIVGIGRYPLKIANSVAKESQDVKFYFLYDEDPANKLNEIKTQLPKNSEVIKIEPNYNYIKKTLKTISPHSLLVMGQRIPDNAIISIAKELNIKTFKLQHGLYIPFMKRNLSMFVTKLAKTIRYLKYANVVATSLKRKRIKTIKDYIDVFVTGKKKITQTTLPLEKINADIVFVYGEYWKKYHNEEYGYSYEQQIVVGYPDLEILDQLNQKPQEDAVCYICQTLVEDGRLPRKEMLDFIKILNNSIGNKKLYIKLHPRSDINLYKLLENKNVVFTNSFPHCSKYIGHYSSMLAIAMHITDKVFLWKFKRHNDYPFYFIKNSYAFSNNYNELKDFINNDQKVINSRTKNNIRIYFEYKKKYIDSIKEIL